MLFVARLPYFFITPSPSPVTFSRLSGGLFFFLCVMVSWTGLAEAEGAEAAPQTLNHLAGEKSPYLIQHATNPVDWYPWGDVAFAKAKRENKPILLSIGYSTCHWCHVMERESFKNKEIADFLNQHFVSIKVDREERPDVDKIYMTAYQTMYQGGGGWPLNMFLTPELKPFSGGTYFPPEDRQGRPGFLRVLKTLAGAWEKQGIEVVNSADELHLKMQKIFEQKKRDSGAVVLGDVERASRMLMGGVDTQHGGWGAGPKFPQVPHLRFLLRQWHRTNDSKALEMVLLTCDKMMQGGIHDHLAGGFHRYTVDEKWLVPHFEKMLYDQAQLLDLYLDVWLISGDLRYREVAVGIADFVLREMQHRDGDRRGGFYCAMDAQSEGKEGKFACWTSSELKALLTTDEYRLIARWYGITEKGNFIDHSDPNPLPNQNILHLADPSWEPTEKEQVALGLAFIKMKEARAKRVPASTDDKVLADWNGMMIASLSRAGRVLGKPEYLTAAKQAHAFIKEKLWDGKLLYHRWRDGERDTSQQASSYLQMLVGSMGLYQTTLDPEYLTFAIQLADGARELFYDAEHGGFFHSAKRPDLLFRLKDDYDGATPTASSAAAMQFHLLAEITGRKDYRKVVEKTLAAHAQIVKNAPHSMSGMLNVADSTLGKHGRLVIAGEKGAEALLAARYSQYSPRLVVMGNRGKVDAFTRGLKPIHGKAAAYYCEGKACQAPVTDAAALRSLLSGKK